MAGKDTDTIYSGVLKDLSQLSPTSYAVILYNIQETKKVE